MPTVTGSSNCSPVRPSRSLTLPSAGRPAFSSSATMAAIGAPSNTGVANLTRLRTEDRAEQALLGRQLGLALRRDLAHQDVALLDLGADVHDAALVQVAERVVRDVRDVAGDLLGTQLRFARLGLVLLDVDRGVHVLLDHALR